VIIAILAFKLSAERFLNFVNMHQILLWSNEIPHSFERPIYLPAYQKRIDDTLTKTNFSALCMIWNLIFYGFVVLRTCYPVSLTEALSLLELELLVRRPCLFWSIFYFLFFGFHSIGGANFVWKILLNLIVPHGIFFGLIKLRDNCWALSLDFLFSMSSPGSFRVFRGHGGYKPGRFSSFSRSL
jgi:hypothetical protein